MNNFIVNKTNLSSNGMRQLLNLDVDYWGDEIVNRSSHCQTDHALWIGGKKKRSESTPMEAQPLPKALLSLSCPEDSHAGVFNETRTRPMF